MRLQIPAGKATTGPPVGPSLAPHGINMMELIKAYNAATADPGGPDRAGRGHHLRGPILHLRAQDPARLAVAARKAAGVEKGSGTAGRGTVGQVTRAQVREIATLKLRDLNARDVEAAMSIVEGTARSMGIQVAEG